MANVVRSVTTVAECHVMYEVFVNGQRKWVMTVYFGMDRRHRAGGAAFTEAAREQEKQAQRLIGELS